MDNSDLSDDALLEGMRDEFAHVRLGAAVEDVVARGRQLRRRRAWPVLGAGTGTVAAVVALTFSLAASGAGPRGAHVVLDAWSVTSKPDGTVSLTIRDQPESGQDRARLGRALRAAGVPAVVRTGLPSGCHPSVEVRRIKISRHRGAVTWYLRPGKLAHGIRVVIVIPAVTVSRGTGSGRRVELWEAPGAARRVHEIERAGRKLHGLPGHANARGLPLPQIVVYVPSAVCTWTAQQGSR
ncbi:MAG TPA: hypothetical protein VEV63_04800 [Streptosporangiaceae bacterium]|nr:hypothetical protein [Streptosporangiaceae bacterium]